MRTRPTLAQLVALSLFALLPHCAPKETGSCTGTLDGAPVRWTLDAAFTKYLWTNPPCGPRSAGNCPRNIIRNAQVYFTVSPARVVGFSAKSPQDIADITAPTSLTATGAMLSASPFMPTASFESAGLEFSDTTRALAGGGHWTEAQPLTNINVTTTRWDTTTWDGTIDVTYGTERVQCTFSVERER